MLAGDCSCIYLTVRLIAQPDILILEDLNVLRSPDDHRDTSRIFISHYFGLRNYRDAEESTTVQAWYAERLLRLRETVFRNKLSCSRRYAYLTEAEAIETATRMWKEINRPNLRENSGPTREGAVSQWAVRRA
jgi:type I pantothenate kinase